MLNADLVESPSDFLNNTIDGIFPFALPLGYLLCKVIVGLRLKELQSYVLKLHFHGVYSQSCCQRRIYVQGFLAFFHNLLMGHVIDCPEIVKSVRKLDYENSYVL